MVASVHSGSKPALADWQQANKQTASVDPRRMTFLLAKPSQTLSEEGQTNKAL
jgi:hypothetical protein